MDYLYHVSVNDVVTYSSNCTHNTYSHYTYQCQTCAQASVRMYDCAGKTFYTREGTTA